MSENQIESLSSKSQEILNCEAIINNSLTDEVLNKILLAHQQV